MAIKFTILTAVCLLSHALLYSLGSASGGMPQYIAKNTCQFYMFNTVLA